MLHPIPEVQNPWL